MLLKKHWILRAKSECFWLLFECQTRYFAILNWLVKKKTERIIEKRYSIDREVIVFTKFQQFPQSYIENLIFYKFMFKN